jgi:hypothetical protein
MTSLEDQLDDETVEAVEEAEKQSKRSKTKYGDLIEANDE